MLEQLPLNKTELVWVGAKEKLWKVVFGVAVWSKSETMEHWHASVVFCEVCLPAQELLPLRRLQNNLNSLKVCFQVHLLPELFC